MKSDNYDSSGVPNSQDKIEEDSLEKEITAGEWQKIRELPAYQRRSRQGRILAIYQALSNRLTDLNRVFYQMVGPNPIGAGKLLKEIKKLRFLQDELSQFLVWEKQNQLDTPQKPIPREIVEIL